MLTGEMIVGVATVVLSSAAIVVAVAALRTSRRQVGAGYWDRLYAESDGDRQTFIEKLEANHIKHFVEQDTGCVLVSWSDYPFQLDPNHGVPVRRYRMQIDYPDLHRQYRVYEQFKGQASEVPR